MSCCLKIWQWCLALFSRLSISVKKGLITWRREFGVAELLATVVVLASAYCAYKETGSLLCLGLTGDAAEYATFFAVMFVRWLFTGSIVGGETGRNSVMITMFVVLDCFDSIIRPMVIAVFASLALWLSSSEIALAIGIAAGKYFEDTIYYAVFYLFRDRLVILIPPVLSRVGVFLERVQTIVVHQFSHQPDQT